MIPRPEVLGTMHHTTPAASPFGAFPTIRAAVPRRWRSPGFHFSVTG